jgi:hypothetical protein
VVRLTEGDTMAESNSPALTRLFGIMLEAVHQAGHFFTPGRSGVTGDVVRLLEQSRLQDVQTRVSTLEYRAGTTAGQRYYEDMRLVFRTALPFLHKWTRVPDDYQTLYQQALGDMQRPDFVATWHALTAWGIKHT